MLGIAALALSSCTNDDNDDTLQQYQAWHDNNVAWINSELLRTNPDGTPFYQPVTPAWAVGQKIYVHWFNDRAATAGNVTPFETSWVSTHYEGYLYDGTLFDESKGKTDNDLFTGRVNQFIAGWQIALQNMHVGDTVQIIIPYDLAYGQSGSGSIPPYSALRFNMRLMDVPGYEARP